MFRSLIIAAVVAFATQIGVCGVVPYKGDLRPEMFEAYQALEKFSVTDSRASLGQVRILLEKSSTSSKSVQAWAMVSYAAVLLEHDSVNRAEEILLDSTVVNWDKVDSWLRNYHSLNLATLKKYQGDYQKANELLNLIRDESKSLLNLKVLQQLGENLRYQGKLDRSLVVWYEAMTIGEHLKDSAEIVDCYSGRGIVRLLQNELDKAELDFRVFKVYNIKINNKKKQALAQSLLSLVDYQKGDYERSIERSLESYNTRLEIGDVKGQGESLNNLALGYMALKNWNQALRYLEEAVQLKARANDLTQMTVILNNTGHCYKNLGNIDAALHFFQLALEKGKIYGQMGDVIVSYNNLVSLFESQDKYDQAFKFQTELVELKDSLAEVEKLETIRELEVKYESDKKDQEITMLQQQQVIITNRWLTLALGLFLAIIIGTLIFDNQKRNHRQQQDLISAEDELQKAELKIMSDLLKHNQQKLSLYTENLIRKNELVNQLEDKLRNAVEESDGDAKKEVKVNFSSVRILTEQDWEEFKQLFDNVHHGLRERLLSEYASLTLAEQRLFLLMKLSMSTKEIANILGVSPDSVKKSRYRLKKKLNLIGDVSLQEFIDGF